MTFAERVRAFEHRLQEHMNEVMCPVHLCLGHEGIAAELHALLRPEDWLFSYHRNHGHYFAKGGSEEKLWDEIMGLPTGLNGGFAGSQSIIDPSINFHSSAIVGGLVGVATGVAYALKMVCHPTPQNDGFDDDNPIVVSIVGDAGTEAGVFWESLNWAALHKLPIAYICENNGMSVDSPVKERQACGISSRVAAFGVDVRRDVGAAIRCARNGYPSFHEAHVKLECDHINMSSLLQKWS